MIMHCLVTLWLLETDHRTDQCRLCPLDSEAMNFTIEMTASVVGSRRRNCILDMQTLAAIAYISRIWADLLSVSYALRSGLKAISLLGSAAQFCARTQGTRPGNSRTPARCTMRGMVCPLSGWITAIVQRKRCCVRGRRRGSLVAEAQGVPTLG